MLISLTIAALLGFALGAWQSRHYWKQQAIDELFSEAADVYIEELRNG